MMNECKWNPAWDEHFEVNVPGPSSRNACQVRAGNSCGSGSLIGWQDGGSLVLTNAHVVGSKIGTNAICRFNFGNGDVSKVGKIIMAAYSSKVTADWAILFLDGFQPIKPVWGTRQRPTNQQRFYTSGAPSCVWPLKHQTGLKLVSNNNTGFAVWDQPAIPGQSGSSVWNVETNLVQLLLTWRTGNGNGAGQPLDYVYNQGRVAMETGALVGGSMPDGLMPLSEVNPDTEEGFFCELSSIRDLPIWFEDQKPTDPDPVDPTPGGFPLTLAETIESYRKIRDEASSKLAKLELTNDSTPTVPPSGGPTFGL
jgi:hypothetical protein